MNWYRTTYLVNGRRMTADVEAHTANDAMLCGAIKLGLSALDDDDQARIVALECIAPPAHVREQQHIRRRGLAGLADMHDKLTDLGKSLGDNKEGDPTP